MKLHRITVVFLIVFLFQLTHCKILWAAVYDWYMPQPMSSTEAAIGAIKDLREVLSLGPGYSIRELIINETGMQINATGNGEEKRFALTFGRVERFDQMYDPEGRLYSFVNFEAGSSHQMVQVGGREYGRKMIDAVVTLALAQNAVLNPYYDFAVTTGSAGYINKVLKKAKVSSGAVVHSGSPTISHMMDDDIITQVTYADKVVPIRDFTEWYTVIREAVAGKAEATIMVRFLRDGRIMNQEIKLINYGHNVKIKQTEQAKPPSKGFGIQLRLMDETELKTLGLQRSVGFLVVSVSKGSAAEAMQLKVNDVVLAINGVDIGSTQQLIELMGKGPIIAVKYWRDGAELISQATLSF